MKSGPCLSVFFEGTTYKHIFLKVDLKQDEAIVHTDVPCYSLEVEKIVVLLLTVTQWALSVSILPCNQKCQQQQQQSKAH